jgi:hypothetical protein
MPWLWTSSQHCQSTLIRKYSGPGLSVQDAIPGTPPLCLYSVRRSHSSAKFSPSVAFRSCRDRSQLPAPNALLPHASSSSTLSASNLGTALALSASNSHHHTGAHNSLANSTSNSKSRSATPQLGPDGTLGIGMNSQGNIVAGGNGGMMIKNGTIYFDCLVCSRSVSIDNIDATDLFLLILAFANSLDCIKPICTTLGFMPWIDRCFEKRYFARSSSERDEQDKVRYRCISILPFPGH